MKLPYHYKEPEHCSLNAAFLKYIFCINLFLPGFYIHYEFEWIVIWILDPFTGSGSGFLRVLKTYRILWTRILSHYSLWEKHNKLFCFCLFK